ncbi:methyl-accepting chemotaxis protein [Actinoplanes sp. KI2]|uniref:methyl-accepting chemotaxis protein n=1 Tax=Actinoplanes sp. KI2 TaxID=2983315 RepID=UPI0021D5D60E|nr:methyl-accepting chemotaxis protein [Actinoplanes sp. KI2]MCU7730762.1 methyl-accepting chemotaxis protein [Actinoplanes sp. KI2]
MSRADEVREVGGHRWMRLVTDRKVATKIGMAVGAMGVAAVGVAAAALINMGAMQDQSDYMYGQTLVPITNLARMQHAAEVMQINVLNAVVSTDDAQVRDFLQAAKDQDATFDQAFAAYTSTDMTGREKAVAQVKQAIAAVRQLRDAKLGPAAERDDRAEFASVRDKEAKPLLASLTGGMDDLIKIETGAAQARNDESRATSDSARTMVIVFVVLGVLLAGAASWLIARGITGPLSRCVSVLTRVQGGDLTQRTGLTGRDEVAQLAMALDASTASTSAMVRDVTESATQVAAAAEELSAVSVQLSASSEETSAQAGTVSAAAEQVSSNVQTVAAGAEQMSASIGEIAGNAGEAAKVATEAAEAATRTNKIVGQLGQSSAQITGVVQLITSIAEQTNLLALNATIEAARAGEQGKGFAVVATEVKDLAQETARATGDIASRIAAIQDETSQAISAIAEIAEVTGRINDYASTIAVAVEEQTATTSEMVRNVAQAASGTGEIAGNIAGVASAADSAASGASETQATANSLAAMATELQQLVSTYQT